MTIPIPIPTAITALGGTLTRDPATGTWRWRRRRAGGCHRHAPGGPCPVDGWRVPIEAWDAVMRRPCGAWWPMAVQDAILRRARDLGWGGSTRRAVRCGRGGGVTS